MLRENPIYTSVGEDNPEAARVAICGLELLITIDVDTKHQMGEIFKFLAGALVGFLIRGGRK